MMLTESKYFQEIEELNKKNSLLKKEIIRLKQEIKNLKTENANLREERLKDDHTQKDTGTEALQESQQRYNSLFNNSTLGIAHCRTITDNKSNPIDYVILQINDAYTKITGIKKEYIEGRTAREVFPGIENFSFDYIWNYGKVALKGGELNFEEYFEALDQWLSIYVYSPIKGEFTAIFTDITERKNSETRIKDLLQVAEHKSAVLNAVIESIPDAVYIGTKNGITQSNHKAIQMLGAGSGDLQLRIRELIKKYNVRWPVSGRILREDELPFVRALNGETVIEEVLVTNIRTGENKHIRAADAPIIVNGEIIGAVAINSEITERKKVEEELRKSEERLKAIFENLTEALIIVDAKENRLDCNPEALRLHGHTQLESKLDFLSKVNEIFESTTMDGKLIPFGQWPINRMMGGEQFRDYPMYLRNKEQGWKKLISYSGSLIRDSNNNPLFGILFMRDITELKKAEDERKKAEEAIRRSEAILKQAETMANLGAWEIEFINTEDTNDNPLRWSDQVYRIFGYAPGSVPVSNAFFFEHVHPDDRQKIHDAVAKALRNRNAYSIEHRIKRADGVERTVIEHADISLDSTGRPERVIGAIQDITERKLAEQKLIQALSQAEEGRITLTALMEYIPIGITIADAPDGKIRMVSRYGQETLDRSNEEITGIPAPEHPSKLGVYKADGITPGLPEELPLSRATMKGEIVKNEAWFVTRSDGTLIPILCNAAPILDKEGEVIGGIIGWQDIAELKRIEQELQQRNEELTRFIYTVSHDLKSPLVTIKMFTLYLRDDIKKQDRSAQERDLGYVENAADKMGKLLEELLELSRIGRKEEPASEVLLGTLARTVIDLLAGRIREKNVKVKITAPSVLLYGHKQRLIQLYQNLLDNAVKFMGDQPHPLVEIGAFIDNDRNNEVVLFVRDNGTGIGIQYQHKIFGLFEKLDPGSEGTGIGLALVKRIVEVHDGHIWFTSANGKGTTFYFTLGGTKFIKKLQNGQK